MKRYEPTTDVQTITIGKPSLIVKTAPMRAHTLAMTQKPQTAFHEPPVMPAIKANRKDPPKKPATTPRRPSIIHVCRTTMTAAMTPRMTAITIVTMDPTMVAIQPALSESEVSKEMTKRPTRVEVIHGNHLAPKKAIMGPKIK